MIDIKFSTIQSMCSKKVSTPSGYFCEILVSRQDSDCDDKIVMCSYENCPIVKIAAQKSGTGGTSHNSRVKRGAKRPHAKRTS
jgi:hypothetical protein